MTAKIWENWEHGPDGNQYVELYRQYAAEQLGLEAPTSPMAPGGYLNYLTQRGFGGSSTETAKGHATAMLNAIANGSPTQPALYRGIVAKPTDVNSQNLVKQLTSLKPGDTIDMPLVSTTRSLGVAAWYAADRVSGVSDKVIMKIQPGARGVAVPAKSSYYPADHEVVTSGKFEVVGISHVKAPYWSRGIFEPRKNNLSDGTTHYEVATYSPLRYTEQQAKKIWDTVQAGKIQSLATDTFKFTDDRNPRSNGSPLFSSWTKQEPTGFTVVEVKMVEPHKVQKSTDHGMTFDALFNDRPFINDDPEGVAKFNPNHDERGRFSSGTGMGAGVAQSILERVKANDGLSVKMTDGSEPTTGYMVAKGTQYGVTVSAEDFYDPTKGPKILADYMKKNKSDLGTGKNYLGLWHNTEDGNVYLDVSQNIQDKGEAISAGQSRDQISIWDVANFAEIQTGGTGVTKQEIGSRGITDEYLGDDGFGDRGLRSEDLGQVSKAQVIYFAPGLKPILKFNPYHDERGRFTTGTGYAQGGYTAEQTYRQNQMKGKGPTEETLRNVMKFGFKSVDEQNKMLADLNQVYSAKISGTDKYGNKTTLVGKINRVWQNGDRINLDGDITDKRTNEIVGRIQRTFYLDGTNNLSIEHDYLAILHAHRAQYAGMGIGKKIIQQSEAYYVNAGIKKITVGTAWDGARVWARAGYDFNPVYAHDNFRNLLAMGIRNHLHDGGGGAVPMEVVNKFNSLMKGMASNYSWANARTLYDDPSLIKFNPMTDKKFPIPNDFASLGYKRGAKNWIGKEVMYDVRVKYQKIVNPEGYNIKTKPARDRNADGLLNTASPRETPVVPKQ